MPAELRGKIPQGAVSRWYSLLPQQKEWQIGFRPSHGLALKSADNGGVIAAIRDYRIHEMQAALLIGDLLGITEPDFRIQPAVSTDSIECSWPQNREYI